MGPAQCERGRHLDGIDSCQETFASKRLLELALSGAGSRLPPERHSSATDEGWRGSPPRRITSQACTAFRQR